MSNLIYIVNYESHDDDYKGAESVAKVIAAYSNKRAAYLVAAKKNLPEFLEYEIRLDENTGYYFKKLSPEARAIVKPLLGDDDSKEEEEEEEDDNDEKQTAPAKRSRPADPIERVSLESLDLPLLVEVQTFVYDVMSGRPGEYSMNASYSVYAVTELEVDKDEEEST